MSTLIDCGLFLKDVVTVKQKASHTHRQVARENDTVEFCEQSVNSEYLYLVYFYTSYVILMDWQVRL